MSLRLLLSLLMAYFLSSSALPGAATAPAADMGQFPAVQAANLDSTQFALPQNFGGQVNLVVISFAREQQETVDSWIPAARQLEAAHGKFRYYELPTMSRENIFYRWWFDAALRSNTTDKDLRSRILTAYVNKHKFLRSMHIANDKNVVAVLIDQSGRVSWREDGAYSEQKGQTLISALPKGM